MSLIITLQTVCHTFVFQVYIAHILLLQVTDELPAGPKRVADPKATMIKVQPLKRSEMQVILGCQTVLFVY